MEKLKEIKMHHEYVGQFDLEYPLTLPIEINNPKYEDTIDNEEVMPDEVIIESEKDLKLLALEMDGLLRSQHLVRTKKLGRIDSGIIICVEFSQLSKEEL